MNSQALLKLGIVIGILMNAFDLVVQGVLLAGLYTAPVFRKPEDEIVYLVLTDFVAAFVFVWLYLKLGSATGPGVAGGKGHVVASIDYRLSGNARFPPAQEMKADRSEC